MNPYTLVAVAVVGIVAFLFSRTSNAKPTPLPSPTPAPPGPQPLPNIDPADYKPSSEERAYNRQKIHEYASMIEDLTGAKGFGDFCVAVSYAESRFNRFARNTTEGDNPNAASGIVGARPKSAFPVAKNKGDWGTHPQDNPDSLFDIRVSVAQAAHYYHRCRFYAKRQKISDFTMLSIRRCWAYPSIADDFDETEKPRSAKVRERFEVAIEAVGLPPSFLNKKAFPLGYNWPGYLAVYAAVGLSKQDVIDMKSTPGEWQP